MPDPPLPNALPPVMQHKLLHVVRMGVTDEGLPYLVLVARQGRIRLLVVYLQADQPAEWYFGYEVYDPETRTKTTYVGPHGDPELDEAASLDGLPGLDGD